MTIVAHVPNVFDRPHFGDKVIFVDSGAEARAADAGLVIVDLGRCADLWDFLTGGRAYLIGFGPHSESGLLREAAEAGYDEVLARSAFFRRLPEILAQFTPPYVLPPSIDPYPPASPARRSSTPSPGSSSSSSSPSQSPSSSSQSPSPLPGAASSQPSPPSPGSSPSSERSPSSGSSPSRPSVETS